MVDPTIQLYDTIYIVQPNQDILADLYKCATSGFI